MTTQEQFGTTGHQYRAITFLPNGQRCECWLPKGTYGVVGECWLSSGRDNDDMARAVKLERWMPDQKRRETWYIGAAVFEAASGKPAKSRLSSNLHYDC